MQLSSYWKWTPDILIFIQVHSDPMINEMGMAQQAWLVKRKWDSQEWSCSGPSIIPVLHEKKKKWQLLLWRKLYSPLHHLKQSCWFNRALACSFQWLGLVTDGVAKFKAAGSSEQQQPSNPNSSSGRPTVERTSQHNGLNGKLSFLS